MSSVINFPDISVAPMMDWTDRHDRYFLRLIAPDIKLYTEMITAQALKHGDVARLLQFHANEKPVVLQLGGSDPILLAQAAKLGEEWGYDEINLNCGCPSPRVSKGNFGACLMLEPSLVADCVAAMHANIAIPVTVKCRIGVDHEDSYEALQFFISQIAEAGCKTFIIHARKAWLSGLSPKENREIPPLRYDVAAQVKKDFPNLKIILNGGIKNLFQLEEHLQTFDGVMIGREAYHNPYFLSQIQAKYFTDKPILARKQVIEKFLPYVGDQLQNGVKLSNITRHILGLFHGMPGAASWRRYISEHAPRPNAGTEVIEAALQFV